MTDFNKKLKELIFEKISIEKVSKELIAELKSDCKELENGVYKVHATSDINDEVKEYLVDTNMTLNVLHYSACVYEIDNNNTSVTLVISWGQNPKDDYFEGLEKVCYFEVEYQILNGEEANFITYDPFYS